MDAHDAYRRCRRIARAHYENFPVASWLLPRRVRGPVAAIYAFARRADDHADEGTRGAADRLASLDAMERDLDATLARRPPEDFLWQALDDAIGRFRLPDKPFRDLLSAFRQDVDKRRYADFGEVLHYCERSANPVGRLLLHLTGTATPGNLADSDCICTALQLINFLQDLHQDFIERDRLYIPQEDLARHGVSEAALAAGAADAAVAGLLLEQVERAAWWLRQGSDLPRRLRGRFGMEIRLIVRGGWRVTALLRAEKPAAPFARPRLGPGDRCWIALGLLPLRALPARGDGR